jgi:hypothetical protein
MSIFQIALKNKGKCWLWLQLLKCGFGSRGIFLAPIPPSPSGFWNEKIHLKAEVSGGAEESGELHFL